MTDMEFSLRPASSDDFEFLFRLRAAALGPYVAQIWGWNEDDQRRRFASAFDHSRCQIVQVLGDDVGVIEMERGAREIAIANIELLPEWQGKGVGTVLLRSVLADADAANLGVSLQVFRINPARRLYERLGFVVVGETATHFQMRRVISDRRQPAG